MSSVGGQGPLGAFVHTSPLSSKPHDPLVSLASHCVREAFGPNVQLVADALHVRGGASTFRQLFSFMKQTCPKPAPRLGIENQSNLTSSSVRASLIVLIQHSIVTVNVNKPPGRALPVYSYQYHPEVARLIVRYSRYVEYIKKAMDVTAACVVETLLLAGRLRTVDVVLQTAEHGGLPKSDRYTVRQTVVDSFWKLVGGGFVQDISTLPSGQPEDEEEEEEAELDDLGATTRAPRRVKIDPAAKGSSKAAYADEDPAVISIITGNAHYNSALPRDAVWRVNFRMFHDSLRAFCLGRFVSELFGHRIQSAGSLVTSALKSRAHKEHVEARREDLAAAASDLTSFSPQDLVKYLPKQVLQIMEKKVGGITVNMAKAWYDLSELRHPVVVRRIGEDRYEVAATSLLDYFRERVIHQIVYDRHGEMGARIISILTRQGWLDSDSLAEFAMIPAKDTREILHTLYRSQYVEIFQLSSARQYNPSQMTYLWTINKHRLQRKATENVATAIWNLRLRRQHQVEVGKDWIERAQQAEETDENEHEMDKINYQKFCLSLERLDCALLQLDETLMVLRDF